MTGLWSIRMKVSGRGGNFQRWQVCRATCTSIFMSEKRKAASVIYNAPFVTSEIVGRR